NHLSGSQSANTTHQIFQKAAKRKSEDSITSGSSSVVAEAGTCVDYQLNSALDPEKEGNDKNKKKGKRRNPGTRSRRTPKKTSNELAEPLLVENDMPRKRRRLNGVNFPYHKKSSIKIVLQRQSEFDSSYDYFIIKRKINVDNAEGKRSKRSNREETLSQSKIAKCGRKRTFEEVEGKHSKRLNREKAVTQSSLSTRLRKTNFVKMKAERSKRSNCEKTIPQPAFATPRTKSKVRDEGECPKRKLGTQSAFATSTQDLVSLSTREKFPLSNGKLIRRKKSGEYLFTNDDENYFLFHILNKSFLFNLHKAIANPSSNPPSVTQNSVGTSLIYNVHYQAAHLPIEVDLTQSDCRNCGEVMDSSSSSAAGKNPSDSSYKLFILEMRASSNPSGYDAIEQDNFSLFYDVVNCPVLKEVIGITESFFALASERTHSEPQVKSSESTILCPATVYVSKTIVHSNTLPNATVQVATDSRNLEQTGQEVSSRIFVGLSTLPESELIDFLRTSPKFFNLF
ncbi:hypothetical protein AVEN_62393-1, partial [Araneus ventricosus]